MKYLLILLVVSFVFINACSVQEHQPELVKEETDIVAKEAASIPEEPQNEDTPLGRLRGAMGIYFHN